MDFTKRDISEFEDIREGILESTFDLALERIDSIWDKIMTKTGSHSIQSQQSPTPSSKSSRKQTSTTCTAVKNLKKEFPIDNENREINTPSMGRQKAPTPKTVTHMKLRNSLEWADNDTARLSNEWGRGVGFAAPILPMDPSFRPGVNKNIQGASKIPLNDYMKYTAGTSQQAVQAQMGMTAPPYYKDGDDIENESITMGSVIKNLPK